MRAGRIVGAAGKPFTTVVNIGIGGSDLGPAMGVQALERYAAGGPRCQFVSNIDGLLTQLIFQDARAVRAGPARSRTSYR